MRLDWKGLRLDISQLEKRYHDTPKFLEHLDEVIAKGL